MLVLSRKKNESIVINDDITIVVVEIRGDKVRLGVEAPKEVPVHRNEVYEAIRRNQEGSTGAADSTPPGGVQPGAAQLASRSMVPVDVLISRPARNEVRWTPLTYKAKPSSVDA